MLRGVFVAAALSGTVIFQATPPVYDATFTVGDTQIYSGTTTFRVDGKGVVTGKMQLAKPLSVVAQLAGSVKEGTWTVDYGYTIPERNCTGLVKGTAQVAKDRKAIAGSVVISGDCSPNPQNATFSFTRQPPKTKYRPLF